jgi:hypothetical protein
MPGAPNAGPAPAPYTGEDYLGQVHYAAAGVSFTVPSAEVLNGSSGNALQESGYAQDVNAGLVTDYYPGAISPIAVGGDPDPGGRDVVAATTAGAVLAADAAYLEQEGDTHGPGSAIGDLMTFPGNPLDPGAAAGTTDPSGAYFDPPRSY